ncbi:MAG: hypothetical protein WAM78_12560, partial [Candidatus Sulfotelmatobacter sp.]
VADDADDVRLLLDDFFEIFRRHGWMITSGLKGRSFSLSIVNRSLSDGNIPEPHCCGETVEYEPIRLTR